MAALDTDIETPRERVRLALSAAVHDSLRPVLLAVAIVYVGFATSHWFSLPRPVGATVAAVEAGDLGGGAESGGHQFA